MCQLIVHADDFGLSEKINEGILYAYRNGILTSASLMANGAAFEHAIALYRTAPTLDLGIHLNLVNERTVLDSQKNSSLLDSKGRLHRNAKVFTRKYFTGQICLQEVKYELEAQIKKVLSQGVKISHLDGHQHLHMLPGIHRIILELAKKYGVPAIRLPSERVRGYMLQNIGMVPRVLELLVLNFFCRLRKKGDFQRANHFVGFFFGGRLNKSNLLTVLQSLPRTGTCELMCHPGFDDPHTQYGDWDYHWSDELTALTDNEIVEFIQSNGIRLISYHELGSGAAFDKCTS